MMRRRLLAARLMAVSAPGGGAVRRRDTRRSHVDGGWRAPRSAQPCDFCVIGGSPRDSRRSLLPAVVAQWRADRWIGFASEVALSQKGFETTTPTLTVSYVEVPALVRLGRLVNPSCPAAVLLEGGPAGAVRVASDIA